MKRIVMLCVGVFYLLVGCSIECVVQQSKQWSWVYNKVIADNEHKASHNKQSLVFAKNDVPAFSQLIFSWNAIRPRAGHFSFAVQARDKATKKWGKWHRMIDWGVNRQQSYLSASDGNSKYVHVRLEADSGKKIDGFRIKITGQGGAALSLVKSLTVATADFTQFAPEDLRNLMLLPSVYVQGVPRMSQLMLKHDERKRLCSPTSCSILTSFLRGDMVNPVQFADKAFDNGLGVFGSWPFNVAHAFEQCEGRNWFFTARLNTFSELHMQLQRGIPTVVSVRGAIVGAPKAYDNGHLLVVVGWDAKRKAVICHDPACSTQKRTFKCYPVESFVRAWERSRRLVYWAEPV